MAITYLGKALVLFIFSYTICTAIEKLNLFFLKRHICIQVTHGVSELKIQKIRDSVQKNQGKKAQDATDVQKET